MITYSSHDSSAVAPCPRRCRAALLERSFDRLAAFGEQKEAGQSSRGKDGASPNVRSILRPPFISLERTCRRIVNRPALVLGCRL